MTTQMTLMYHPLIPATSTSPVRVAEQAVDDFAARGWLLFDPDAVLPDPATPYYTKEALLSQITGGASPIGTALRAAFGLSVAATATANATLVVNKHTPVDASGAARTMTLPTGQAEGARVIVEKLDATTNAVIVSGSIRGSAGTVSLIGQFETLSFVADSAGSWHPGPGHKTKVWLDNNYGRPDAIVDAAGGQGVYTDLQAAIDALTVPGKVIHVRSDLTTTVATIYKRQVTVVFLGGSRILNNGAAGTDVFKSSIPIGSNGQVNFVTLVDPYIVRAAGATGRGGKAISFHGAYGWKVYRPRIDAHGDALYFDASPYPSGLGSHNSVYDGDLTSCDTAIHFTGSANVNQVLFTHSYGCGKHVWAESGIDNIVSGARIENIGANQTTTAPVIVDGGVLYMPGFHIENAGTGESFDVNGNGSIFGNGNAYNDTAVGGQGLTVVADTVQDMDLQILGQRWHRSRSVAQRTSRTAAGIANIAEWYGVTADGGPETLRFALRSDGPLRVPPLASSPAAGSLSSGDTWMETLTNGLTPRYRDGSNTRDLAAMHMIGFQAKLPTISAAGTFTIFRATDGCVVKDLLIFPDATVAFDASNFWTVVFREYNGNVLVGDIGTYTQGAAMSLGQQGVTSQTYQLAANRTVRAVFTPTGAPPAINTPLTVVRVARA